MTVLHVLDHSLPVTSGDSTRSRSIVVFQHAAGPRPGWKYRGRISKATVPPLGNAAAHSFLCVARRSMAAGRE